jgi:hypothetical protein
MSSRVVYESRVFMLAVLCFVFLVFDIVFVLGSFLFAGPVAGSLLSSSSPGPFLSRFSSFIGVPNHISMSTLQFSFAAASAREAK